MREGHPSGDTVGDDPLGGETEAQAGVHAMEEGMQNIPGSEGGWRN